MSELSKSYRERLARMSGDSKSLVGGRHTTTTATSSTSNNMSNTLEYKQLRSEMLTSTVTARSDAAALQNDLAQRYNLQNAIRPSNKV